MLSCYWLSWKSKTAFSDHLCNFEIHFLSFSLISKVASVKSEELVPHFTFQLCWAPRYSLCHEERETLIHYIRHFQFLSFRTIESEEGWAFTDRSLRRMDLLPFPVLSSGKRWGLAYKCVGWSDGICLIPIACCLFNLFPRYGPLLALVLSQRDRDN